MAQPFTVAAAGARTTSGNSGPLDADGDQLNIIVDVTAVTGVGPSMTCSVLWSNDGTNFADSDPADVFTAITAAAKKVKRFTVKGAFFRLDWAITGTTPSFTFSASALPAGA